MVKPFHIDLKKKMKFIAKLRPIGTEFRDASDERANIMTDARTL